MTNRARRPFTALALLGCGGGLVVLGVLAGTASAQAPLEQTAGSGAVQPTLIGNPSTGVVGFPAPVGSVPVTDPGAAPRGSSPATHVYARSTGGQPQEYAAAEFQLPTALEISSLILTAADDAGPGEDVSAATATLTACGLSGTLSPAAPNAPISHDCSAAVTGRRVATSSGGAWTFDLGGLSSGVQKSGRFGVALVPAGQQPDTFTVSLIRASFRLAYQGSAPQDAARVRVQPAAAAPLATPGALNPKGDAVLPATAVLPGSLPPGASTLAPKLAASEALVNHPAARSSRPATPTNWRPLLLLLVPAVPFAALAISRRLADAQNAADLLAEMFPQPTESS